MVVSIFRRMLLIELVAVLRQSGIYDSRTGKRSLPSLISVSQSVDGLFLAKPTEKSEGFAPLICIWSNLLAGDGTFSG